jgi:hypothetical protein
MKYFFEIENWQKYIGFIFKQGSNASTTSMHPTPLVPAGKQLGHEVGHSPVCLHGMVLI